MPLMTPIELATLRQGRIAARMFEPPAGVGHVIIFADNDENFAGQAAAYRAAHRLALRGIEVEVVTPPAAGDWLDHLIQTKLRAGSASD